MYIDKPSSTIKPDRPVTPKRVASEISVSLDMDTNKMQLKLRAISKYTSALADELDAIDNDWKCDHCGSYSYSTMYTGDGAIYMVCNGCGERVESDELPTQLEGSD